jgi:hypothetical protein
MIGANVDSGSDYWSHGVVIENLSFRNDAGRTSGSGLRITPGEGCILRNLSFTAMPEGGIRLQRNVAPARIEACTFFLNQYGVWLDGCSGTVDVFDASGDDNTNSFFYVGNTSTDPNTQGRALSLTVHGLKAETGTASPAATSTHNPIIRMVNANEAMVHLIGGRVADFGASSTQNKAVVTISGGTYSGQVILDGLNVEKYLNLIVDNVKSVTIPHFSYSGGDDWPNFRTKVTLTYRAWTQIVSQLAEAERAMTLRGTTPMLRMRHDPTSAESYDLAGVGTPAGVVSAPVGSTFRRLDGGAATTFYVKESGGSGNTGWVAK